MQRFALLLGLFGLVGSAWGCDYAPLAAPEDVPRTGVIKALVLAENPATQNELNMLAKTYSRTFTGKTLKTADYLTRAREFAAEDLDSHSVVDSIPTASGGSRTFKLNVSTGDLLVTDKQGRLILYLRLPVGERGFGKFKNTADVFEELAMLIPDGVNGKVIPGFSVGDHFVAQRFPSEDQADRHFRKHVLGVEPFTPIADLANRATGHNEFPAMLGSFLQEVQRRGEDIATVYAEHRQKYIDRAIAFAEDNSPHILTITNYQPDPLNPGKKVLMSYRFNPYTNETLVLNRSRNTIITYHKIDTTSRLAKGFLKKLNLPEAATPFEYFLATSSAQRP